MNRALAPEGSRRSDQFPPGLKPNSFPTLNGAAKAAPLQLRWTWWTLVPLTFFAAVIAAPYFLTHGFLAMGLALERGFAIVCHQRPERSFWIFGAEVAVCSRCLGIYLGAAVGLLFRTSHRIALRLLIAAAALNLLDAMTEVARWHGNWLVIRFVFGLLLGGTAALLVSSVAASESRTPQLSDGSYKS